MLEVKPTGDMEMAEMPMKPLPVLFKKYLLGGCIINLPPSNCHCGGGTQSHHVIPCYYYYDVKSTNLQCKKTFVDLCTFHASLSVRT